MSVNRPRNNEKSPPDLMTVSLPELDALAPQIKRDLKDLLRSDTFIDEQKVVLLFQYALYERVLLNDVFMEKVLTPDFRQGVEDILLIFRQLNRCRDKVVRKDNINDRAETLTAFLINAIHLAKEGLRDNSGCSVDVYVGVEKTARMIGEILHSTDPECGEGDKKKKK